MFSTSHIFIVKFIGCRLNFSLNFRVFLLLVLIAFTIFVFTNDGHRYSFDEDVTQRQSDWIATQQPHPNFKEGESAVFFDYPELWPNGRSGSVCKIGIICSPAYLGHVFTEIPFILINENLNIINNEDIWTIEDFDIPHYVWWRNSIDSNFTFMELFYGPIFSSFAVGFLFLICRNLNFRLNSSILVSILFALTTITWAYSQTSLSSVPMVSLNLLAFLFFIRFQKTIKLRYLIFSGLTMGYAFNTRPDSILIIFVTGLFLFYFIAKQFKKGNTKQEISKIVQKLTSFGIPIISSVLIFQLINFLRFETGVTYSGFSASTSTIFTPAYVSLFGLLFSPGLGLFIFSPILFISIISFYDYFQKDKANFFLIIGIIVSFLVWFTVFIIYWHGLVGWSARYLLPIVPFLMIPLASSFEKRSSKFFIASIVVLASLGFFFNITYLIQDVSWFVWGQMGEAFGLYGLPSDGAPLRISPMTIWTFEFSQLTHTIYLAFNHLQPDLYLLKIFGGITYSISLFSILSILSYFLIKTSRNTMYNKISDKSN